MRLLSHFPRPSVDALLYSATWGAAVGLISVVVTYGPALCRTHWTRPDVTLIWICWTACTAAAVLLRVSQELGLSARLLLLPAMAALAYAPFAVRELAPSRSSGLLPLFDACWMTSSLCVVGLAADSIFAMRSWASRKGSIALFALIPVIVFGWNWWQSAAAAWRHNPELRLLMCWERTSILTVLLAVSPVCVRSPDSGTRSTYRTAAWLGIVVVGMLVASRFGQHIASDTTRTHHTDECALCFGWE